MNGHRPAFCSSCGAGIWWRQTAAGKYQPMDVAYTSCRRCAGKMELDPDCTDCAGTGSAQLTHFATCANAAQHRKAR